MSALNNLVAGIYTSDYLSSELIEKNRIDIDISEYDVVDSSIPTRGNQRKWYNGTEFIKLNYLGYEDIAEIVSAWVMRYVELDTSYLLYYPCRIYDGSIFLGNGCYSYNYLGYDSIEISIGHILSMNNLSFSITYNDLIDVLYDYIGDYAKQYIDDILFVDAITRNDDRHFYNMSLVSAYKHYRIASIYDNGSACLSDCISYPIDSSFEDCITICKSKPFNIDFTHPNKYFVKRRVDSDAIVNGLKTGNNVYFNRAVQTIHYGLSEIKGVLWDE